MSAEPVELPSTPSARLFDHATQRGPEDNEIEKKLNQLLESLKANEDKGVTFSSLWAASNKVVRVVQVVFLAISVIFMGGVGYKTWKDESVTKVDLNKALGVHSEHMHPAAAESIDALDKRLAPIEDGVENLVKRAKKADEYEGKMKLLKAYDREHKASLDAWAADRAAGIRNPKPTRKPQHIELADALRDD